MLRHLLGLTPKQKAFADAYLELNGNGPEAALAAYHCSSRNSARVMAFKCLHNEKVLDYLESVMARDDLPERAVNTIIDLMNAVIYDAVNGKLAKFPDHKTRLHGVRAVLRICGIRV